MERRKFIQTAGYSAAAACIPNHLTENKSVIPDPGNQVRSADKHVSVVVRENLVLIETLQISDNKAEVRFHSWDGDGVLSISADPETESGSKKDARYRRRIELSLSDSLPADRRNFTRMYLKEPGVCFTRSINQLFVRAVGHINKTNIIVFPVTPAG